GLLGPPTKFTSALAPKTRQRASGEQRWVWLETIGDWYLSDNSSENWKFCDRILRKHWRFSDEVRHLYQQHLFGNRKGDRGGADSFRGKQPRNGVRCSARTYCAVEQRKRLAWARSRGDHRPAR